MEYVAFAGIMITGILLLAAVLTKLQGGLIFSFPMRWLRKWDVEQERKAGMKFADFVFRYVPPFFIASVITLLLS